jgi:hypothetical protein
MASIWSIFSEKLAFVGRAAGGTLKKNQMMMAERPPMGRLIQKHHRHEMPVVKTPPSNGPSTDAIPNAIPTKPVYKGRFAGGARKAMMVKPPVARPAHPMPAIARPTINVTELGATAHIRLPNSKMKSDRRKVHFKSKNLYAFPHADWKLPLVMKNADPYQLTWLMDPNSSVIFGIAVATIVWSEVNESDLRSPWGWFSTSGWDRA